MGVMVMVGVGVGVMLALPARGTVCVITVAGPELRVDAVLETLTTVGTEPDRELVGVEGTTGT